MDAHKASWMTCAMRGMWFVIAGHLIPGASRVYSCSWVIEWVEEALSVIIPSKKPLLISIWARTSVSKSCGQWLQIQVRVQPEPLPNWWARLSMNPNCQLGYGAMVNSQPVWIGRVVRGSPSGSIHWFNWGSFFWNMWIVSYQHRILNNQGYVLACFAACIID